MLKNNPISRAWNIVVDVKEQKSADDESNFRYRVIIRQF